MKQRASDNLFSDGPMIDNHAAWLIVGGFTHADDWRLKPDGSRAVFCGEAPKEAGVYAFLVDGVISYVGSAQIGIKIRLRRYVLADNKRTSMRVRQAIEAELQVGRTVEVFAIVPEPINCRGLPIDPVVGLEEGLALQLRFLTFPRVAFFGGLTTSTSFVG